MPDQQGPSELATLTGSVHKKKVERLHTTQTGSGQINKNLGRLAWSYTNIQDVIVATIKNTAEISTAVPII